MHDRFQRAALAPEGFAVVSVHANSILTRSRETFALKTWAMKITVTARLLPRLMVLDSLDDVWVVDDGMKEAVSVFGCLAEVSDKLL